MHTLTNLTSAVILTAPGRVHKRSQQKNNNKKRKNKKRKKGQRTKK